MLTNNHLS